MKRMAICFFCCTLSALACGGEDSTNNSGDSSSNDVRDSSTPLDQITEDMNDTAEPDSPSPDISVFPDPADPLPTVDNGTYSWTDGTNKITFTHKDGLILVLEASFGCIGSTGCKVRNEFNKMTCNAAYEKGYSIIMGEGKFSVTGIRGTDRVVGSVQAKDRIAIQYELRPEVSCCTQNFIFEATWKSADDCSDYALADCDPYTDENCQDGYNCIYNSQDKPTCVVAGELKISEACATQVGCGDGVCMALQGMDKNHCLKYCKKDSDCGYMVQCIGLQGKNFSVCSLPSSAFEKCNLLQQNCTKQGEACFFSSSTVYQPICMTAGSGDQGDPCNQSTDCAKGYDCIASKECMKICDTKGGDPTCNDPFTPCPEWVSGQNAGYCGE